MKRWHAIVSSPAILVALLRDSPAHACGGIGRIFGASTHPATDSAATTDVVRPAASTADSAALPSAGPAAAPERPNPFFIQYTAGGELGLLQGDLWTNLRTVAFGVRFSAAIGHHTIPVRLGLDLDLFRYNSRTQYYAMGPIVTDTGTIVVTNSQTTRANILGLGMFARFQPKIGYVEPFVELVAGGKWFETIARTESYSPVLGQVSGGSRDFSEVISTFGVGAGVEIRLTNLATDDFGVVHLHLGCRYLWGGESSYPKPAGSSGYITVRSATDLFVPMVAFTGRFGPRSFEAKP